VYVRVRARIAHPLQIRDQPLRCAGGQCPMAKSLSGRYPCGCGCGCGLLLSVHKPSSKQDTISQEASGSPRVPVVTSDICIMPIILPISREKRLENTAQILALWKSHDACCNHVNQRVCALQISRRRYHGCRLRCICAASCQDIFVEFHCQKCCCFLPLHVLEVD